MGSTLRRKGGVSGTAAEYSVQVRIPEEPAFVWWVPHVLKWRAQIIAKVKSKYWQRTHKFGIRIPKSIKEALRVDAENGKTLWWDAIALEMSNVRVAFEEYDGELTQDGKPKGYNKSSVYREERTVVKIFIISL
jgi:hypothetical protein